MKEGKSIVEHHEHDNDEGRRVEAIITHERKLQIARILYRMMIGKFPGRLIILCDQEQLLARSDRPETMPPLS